MCVGARVCADVQQPPTIFSFFKGVKFVLSPIIYICISPKKNLIRKKFLAEEKGVTIFVSRGEKWWQVGAK